ncbi:MAG: FHA domain-containing protein [Candidatus Obscuribacterales bacterium]|jgi:pSer/pThr/pTyr-binding forkhead associated (FHA) protein|nr:FHA domain-containing protein [Candidatus Obscuribacterales bacterium]
MAEESTFCSGCGEPSSGKEFCPVCLSHQTSAEKLDKQLAEIILDRNQLKYPVITRWVRIGRDPTNQIVLNDDRFGSRFHAWITYEAGRFWLEDLGSTNGTVLNGVQVGSREALSSGDKIRIGETDLTFVLLD